MKMMPQQYCLRWKHHHSNVQNMFAQLLEKERFCDVTLYCSPNFSTQVPNKDTVDPQNIRGVSLRAHRVVLAACSELLGSLLGAHEALGEPVLVIDGAEPRHLKALLDYMYTGEMNVHHSQLASLLKTAEELRIKGLTDIRWNNKDEPPDCQAGNLGITTTTEKKSIHPEQKSPEVKQEPRHASDQSHVSDTRHATDRHGTDNRHATETRHGTEKHANDNASDTTADIRTRLKKESESDLDHKLGEKYNVNGGPPPLIKLPTKDKGSPVKRENSDSDSPSPKRQRMTSATENTDDDESRERDQEWQHGNLDITAERVVGWGIGESGGEWSRDASDDEWADAPADIGSFLHTRLRVDGDNSADEESNDEGSPTRTAPTALSTSTSTSTSVSASSGISPADIKVDMLHAPIINKPTMGPKSGPTDPRFTDVVKLNDYLQHGRRPQFWEENYVKRVMEAVRLKELEMKQAAEILGVSYGTLYGRYRDVYGCINRPYREGYHKAVYSSTARDFWQAKGPSEVLDRLQRGDISLDAASQALGVTPSNLAAYVADVVPEKDFEPIPIEIDPSLKLKPRTFHPPAPGKRYKVAPTAEKPVRKVVVGSLEDEDPIPATVITTHEGGTFAAPTTTTSGKWPSIRVASLDTLRDAPPADPSQLMRTRPDLTIVAARRTDPEDTT